MQLFIQYTYSQNNMTSRPADAHSRLGRSANKLKTSAAIIFFIRSERGLVPIQPLIQQNSSIPNVVVVVLFIIFFPVGLLLILLRAIIDRNKPYAAMKNHYFSSRILFVFFGLLSISYFAQLFAGSRPLFYVYFICILIIFLPALYMHLKAKELKRKLDDEEIRRQLAAREWFEEQQRMQWTAEQQRQQNAGPYQYPQNGAQQQYWQNPLQQQYQHNGSQQQRNAPSRPKTVTCTGCGARAIILPEENKNCEYCGFTLNYS